MRSRPVFRCAALLLLVTAFLVGAPAHAQDPSVLQKVTDLNKKAVDAYENLDMEEASKYLRQALELCAAEGLNNHKAKARTHIHLGIVMVAGLKQRERGIQQFKRALEIDPTIKPTKSLVNPDIQAAFDEAAKDMGPGVGDTGAKPADATSKAPETAPAPTPESAPPHGGKGIVHTPVTDARPGTTITIKASIEGSLGQDKVILAYRPDGATDFLARDMEKDQKGWYVARIPQPATLGSVVSYYIEARTRAGTALAANGSAAEPHVISLSPDAPVAPPTGDDASVAATVHRKPREGDVEEVKASESGEHKFFVSMGIGTGYGWAKGTPEVNQTDKFGHPIDFGGGFAPAQLLHLAPEAGFFMSPNLLLSLQGRFQFVTAATEVLDASCPENKDANGIGVCAPAKGAIAILGKATWLLGEPAPFRMFVSLAAGGGEIRHLITIDRLTDCGPNGHTQCTDTVLGGILLLGPGAGFGYELSKSLSFVASLNSLVGLPNPTVNFDLNVGMAVQM
jgi:tetratricopeptide (TPR) repeat protein